MLDRQRKLSWWEKIVEPMVASRFGGWYFLNIGSRIDPILIRWTNGRLSTALAQPVGLVTMIGAKSGLSRQVPLLCIPDGENYIIVASRAGDTRHPGWYYNLRANPEVTVLINGHQGTYIAHETTGAEREVAWRKAVDFFVGYETYQERAGERLIPVFVLRAKSLGSRVQQQPTVLITGGSSGIGFELAKLFAANQYQLVIVSKSAEQLTQAKTYLEENYDVNLIAMQKDLTLKASVLEVYNEVKERGITVNVLVNNAGVGSYGYFHELDLDREYEMIQLNVVATMMLSKLFLRDMIARNEGQILNVASVAGLQPNPLFASYGASKSFVVSLSRAMSYEAQEKATNVTVTVLCPPATRMTGFAKRAGMEGKLIFRAPGAMESAQVARGAYQALQKGQEFVILPAWNGMFLRMVNRLLPTRIVMASVRRILAW